MKTSVAHSEGRNVGPARPAGAFDHRGVIAVAEPRFAAVRALSDDLANMLQSFAMPDDQDEYAGLLEKLPSAGDFADTVAALDRALTQPATIDQAKSLVVAMMDGLAQPAGAGAKGRIAALVIALQADVLAVDGEMQPVPISAEVLAATIARLFRHSKRAPLPCELLKACMMTRTAVSNLLHRLRDVESNALDLRKQLEWRVNTMHDIAVEEGVTAIPF
jgi:hypothetical protein